LDKLMEVKTPAWNTPVLASRLLTFSCFSSKVIVWLPFEKPQLCSLAVPVSGVSFPPLYDGLKEFRLPRVYK
jgi:hypothetical protein